MRVEAEGSIWMLTEVSLSEAEFAAATGAIKVSHVSRDIWRLYFPPAQTPRLHELREKSGATHAQCVVGPDHIAKVTPTLGGGQ